MTDRPLTEREERVLREVAVFERLVGGPVLVRDHAAAYSLGLKLREVRDGFDVRFEVTAAGRRALAELDAPR